MNKGKTLWVIAATSAILFGAAATSALAGESMGYGSAPSPPPRIQVPAAKMDTKPSSTTKAVRPELAKPINEAIELDKKKDYQGALAKAKEADAVTDKNPYEDYIIAKLIGIYSKQLHDSVSAAMAFNRALASNGAPGEDLPLLLGIAMAANIDAKNYALAVSNGEQLQKLGPMETASSENLALAYYFNGNYPNALKTARAVADQQSSNGGSPDLQTLQILMNSQIKTNDRAGARQTLAKLCSLPTPPSDLKCPAGK